MTSTFSAKPRLSILDLAPITPGGTVAQAFDNAVALARAAEESGYERVWYAEHHNMARIASSATSLLIGHVAGRTSTIRLGAGGIMLPNHAPLTIAEQFGTLASLHPGRIDLGLGRAPGSDQVTMRAMRRNPMSADSFPQDVLELQGFLGDESRVPGVRATPGAGTHVPLYILGSSMFGARLAAAYGLPYAFASHFSPGLLYEAVAAYRSEFQPSAQLSQPYVIAGVNVIAAPTAESAREQFTITRRIRVRGLISRSTGPAGAPSAAGSTASTDFTDEEIDEFLTTPNGRQIGAMMTYSAVGTPDEVRSYLTSFADRAQADELIVAHQSTQIADRLESVRLTAAAVLGAPLPS
ncbi:alkanal monooxygenase [Actinoplanes sp. SE50]|uniref:LLM class flavin-dependent oxidoreductase n=1 Tax=unclassified Actinoplanes TaxID=2626549 RepID=UPI00023EBBCD|nr:MULTISPECIES: LLM class flavin-dependent oxidoreductase [unclassified Actinoplanes]AEV85682.1 F420-dependent methylene-tetrahydromethanopterin reductase [Actinoplanes sp. SE50/110]ATO84075.1 alkanal monooxygenase [Actinoplanes sp. SE50]SLM01485.1 alkanal monooxygenase [Actinoplanes sp. SE50/110]